MAHVGAVQRDRMERAAQGERRPRGQAEMGVHDVKARRTETPAQHGRRDRVGQRARQELEQLDLDVGDCRQRGHLIANEDPPRRVFARGRHV